MGFNRVMSSSLGRLFASLALAFVVVSGALAQGHAPTQVLNASALQPPAGARVAIIVFSNLQCPACAHTWPLLRKAAATYHIPLVDYEVEISSHNWSDQAALNALWFASKNPAVGDAYRDAVFANQASIYSPVMLRQFTDNFARSHNLQVPFSLDPQGKLQSALQAEYNLSTRTGIHSTPTIFIVTSGGKGAPFAEVLDQDKLYQMIDQALASTRQAAPARPARK
jgi:protein-disulfide isomerase